MKINKKIGGLAIIAATLSLGLIIGQSIKISAQNETSDEVQKIFTKYYNDGYYLKQTSINLDSASVDELAKYFHASVTELERDTYFEGNSLWMTNANGVNSGYGTVTKENLEEAKKVYANAQIGDMTNFSRQGDKDTINYVVNKSNSSWVDPDVDGMEGYYITLQDMISECKKASWEYSGGTYFSNDKDIIEYFKLITAPCFIGTDKENNHYLTFDHVSLYINQDNTLQMSLYVDSLDSGKTKDGSSLFSTATINPICNVKVEGEHGTTTLSESENILGGSDVQVTFKPDHGYSVISYTLTNAEGSTKIAAYNHTYDTFTVTSNTTISVEYDKSADYTMFNYNSGTSRAYYYKNGGFANSSGKVYTYDDVITSIAGEYQNGEVGLIDSSIFSVEPYTTFANGKWANLYYASNGYGLSLYSEKTGEHSGITFNSTEKIYSITLTYYDSNYFSRALVESNDVELVGHKEDDVTYSYVVDGYTFSIKNVSGGFYYLYIPAIEIVYSNVDLLENPITITYDSNGGEGTMESLVTDKYTFTLDECAFEKEGYIFAGWSTTPDGIVEYRDGDTIDGQILEDTTLYAIYIADVKDIIELIKAYNAVLGDSLDDVYAFYGGEGKHDITRYIPSFNPELADSFELQFGEMVYVGDIPEYYDVVTKNNIKVSQSYATAGDITLLDAYIELLYSYYYQGTQIQYDQGSNYQRKIRDMVPEDATELYQKYMDCSTYLSNSYYNAFGQIVIPTGTIDNVTTNKMITYARDYYGKSAEVVLYRDNIQSYTDEQKAEALREFQDNLQAGDIYLYRHDETNSNPGGHVMLYLGNGYFLHSTGKSYQYGSGALYDQTDSKDVGGYIGTEGSVRYESADETVYKSTGSNKTRYLFYYKNDRYAILRPLNREGLTITPQTIARVMATGLEIEKSADKTTSVSLGDYINYTISITNNSDKVMNNVSVSDTVAEYTTFDSMENKYYNYQDGTNLLWNITSISPKTTITVSYRVKVTSKTSNVGKMISSTGSVGHIELNTLNMSIGTLTSTQLDEFTTMTLQYLNNGNVYYDVNANNSTLDPTNNIVTFADSANFVSTLYKRYYESIGKTLDITSDLSPVSNTTFMNSLVTTKLQTTTKLSSMLVNGGYGGTVFTKDYYMDRMRTIKTEYLLPGDIISYVDYNETEIEQYIYLGNVSIEGNYYENVLIGFSEENSVNIISGDSTLTLFDRMIGYKRFAIIRPSLYM